MAMNVQFDEVFEHVMMNAVIAACDGNGVLDGLTVSEKGTGANMSVDVAAGNAWIDGTKYTESSTVNLSISAADATYDRKDLVTYDSNTSNPIVTTGTATATPEPPDIPSGNVLLAIVDVAAGVTQITNADITDGRVIMNTPLHGASEHADVPRELWIPATHGTDGLGDTYIRYVGAVMTDAANTYGYGTFKVPDDFVSGGVLKAVIISSGDGNMVYYIGANFGSNGEGAQTHQLMTSEITEAVVSAKIDILDTTLTLTSVAEGDVVGGRFYRRGSAATDTVGAVVHFLGFIFEYTAEQ